MTEDRQRMVRRTAFLAIAILRMASASAQASLESGLYVAPSSISGYDSSSLIAGLPSNFASLTAAEVGAGTGIGGSQHGPSGIEMDGFKIPMVPEPSTYLAGLLLLLPLGITSVRKLRTASWPW